MILSPPLASFQARAQRFSSISVCGVSDQKTTLADSRSGRPGRLWAPRAGERKPRACVVALGGQFADQILDRIGGIDRRIGQRGRWQLVQIDREPVMCSPPEGRRPPLPRIFPARRVVQVGAGKRAAGNREGEGLVDQPVEPASVLSASSSATNSTRKCFSRP